MHRPQTILEKLYIAILLLIFGGIVLHAPLSVGFGTLFPDHALIIKSWKEILMAVDTIILLFLLFKKKQFKLLSEPVLILSEVYIALHLLILVFLRSNVTAVVSGLMIDLRYVVFFVLVYLAIKMWSDCRNCFIKVGVIGALIVTFFALLQVFILPKDILKYIGYGANTIMPYMTVDQNQAFVRINSTLRGPNPLGAYMVILISLIAAFLANKKLKYDKKSLVILAILTVGSVVALWCSYSRSALVIAILSVIVILFISLYRKLFSKKVIIGGIVLSILIIFSLSVLVGKQFMSNVLLHENPNGGSSLSSNDGHISSLKTGFNLMISQPFGAGIGSTGSASLHGSNPIIIENQYLFIAHEAGWLGLGLFISIFSLVVVKLWKKREDWLALGVCTSGVGLAIIGLLLPVWADDTVSIIWWALAAIVIGGNNVRSKIK